MDYKAIIIDALSKLRKQEIANKQPFKARAYAQAIESLNTLDKITSLDDVENLPKIGEKIRAKIDEILTTGKLERLEIEDNVTKVITELTRVHGIGPSKAREFYDLDIRSIEDLRTKNPDLTKAQQIGLKYLEEFEARIPRLELSKHEAYIKTKFEDINPKLNVTVVGSYRRGAKDSGDIDIIISHSDDPENIENELKDIVNAMKKDKYLTDDLALGSHKYLGVCRLKHYRKHRRIDFLYSRAHEYPFSLLYFTGSKEFNVYLRNLAIAKGLSLSEYGLKKNKSLIKEEFKTEENILKYLGCTYVPPTERNKGTFEKYCV